MTAHVLNENRDKCIAAGMNDFIAKPIHIKTLSTMLEKYLIEEAGFDMSRLVDIFGDDQVAIDEFKQAFLRSTQLLLKELKQLIDSKDVMNAQKTFHTLKGSAANSGVMKIHLLAKEAEHSVANQEWGKAQELMKKIDIEIQQLKNRSLIFENDVSKG